MIAEVSLKKNPVVRGATWRLKVKYLQPDETTPVDMTGCTARVRVVLGNQPDLEWDSEIDTETGEIVTELTPEQSAEVYFKSAVMFLEVLFASETRVLFTGVLETA